MKNFKIGNVVFKKDSKKDFNKFLTSILKKDFRNKVARNEFWNEYSYLFDCNQSFEISGRFTISGNPVTL